MRPSEALLIEIGQVLDKQVSGLASLNSESQVRTNLSEIHRALLMLLRSHERTMKACRVPSDQIYTNYSLADMSLDEQLEHLTRSYSKN